MCSKVCKQNIWRCVEYVQGLSWKFWQETTWKILLRGISIKRYIFVFSGFGLFPSIIKMTATKDQYMEQPRSSTHSKIEILFSQEFLGKLNIRTLLSSEVKRQSVLKVPWEFRLNKCENWIVGSKPGMALVVWTKQLTIIEQILTWNCLET